MRDKGFQAFRIHRANGGIQGRFEGVALNDLDAGTLVIRTLYSNVNYKDALAATGRGKILRRFPLVGGIDAAGMVESSEVSGFEKGDLVLVCGCGLSETRDGGYAEYLRVPAECAVHLPPGMTPFDAMAIGTAGFTAALAVQRMEENGQTPALGPVIVSGASGGVGSFSIDLLSGIGYEVVALTGKANQAAYLRSLGAARVLDSSSVEMGSAPLEQGQWGGAVDTLGGAVLSWFTRSVRPFGNVASIGLAADSELHTSVMPFILRGVSLLGINSTLCPPELRRRIWSRLAAELKPRHLDTIVSRVIDFKDLPRVFDDFMARKVVGRIVVRIGARE